MTITYIFLTNGVSIQTTDNSAADIAGLVNVGTQKIYTCVDHFNASQTHHIVAEHIVEVYDITV